ncbi:MAG: transcriptional regulator [Omnitrophica WOR_2 bacterium GWA2_47_8]|nr:MAG: transcriptional regulator [Omnitrophica WOR_2 bacterium GWA2_47_8]
MRKDIREMILETYQSFFEAGAVDQITLKEVRALCLPEVKPFPPHSITRLRRKLKLSQVALAHFINTSVSTVQKWEQGAKKPSGPALKLLHIIDEKGLEGVL